MNNYLKQLHKATVDSVIPDFLSNIEEGYFVYKDHSNKIHVNTLDYLRFDPPELTVATPRYLEAEVRMALNSDEECLKGCSELLTTYKQNKEYENKIHHLEQKLKQVTEQRNKWWSAYLNCKNGSNNYTIDTNNKDIFYAVWDDFNYSGPKHSIMFVPISKEQFLKTDYIKMFQQNPIWSSMWEPIPKSFAGNGCNHWFVICDAEHFGTAINHLLMYSDDKFKTVPSTLDYMYNRLDEIWGTIYGIEHTKEDD